MVDLESEVIEQMNQRITKSFLDLLILLELRKEAANDCDFATYISNKFHTMVEPESVFSALNLLEKNQLVRSEQVQEKKIYVLTRKGEETVSIILSSRHRILGLVLNILTG